LIVPIATLIIPIAALIILMTTNIPILLRKIILVATNSAIALTAIAPSPQNHLLFQLNPVCFLTQYPHFLPSLRPSLSINCESNLYNPRTLPMARPKRTSPALTKAEQREAGMRSIDATLDLGNGLNLQNYNHKIQNLRSHLSLYNTSLAQLDDLTRKIKAIETDLNKTSEQMLLSVGGRYGKDSSEYGKAGGSPRGERRRRATIPPTAPIEEKNLEPVIPPSMNGKTSIITNGNGKAPVTQS
jgi:hypothetical protein